MPRKVFDFTLSIFREIGYGISVLPSRIFGKNESYHQCTSTPWKKDSQGLYVFIHGLNGHPSIWDGHIAQLKKETKSQFDIFVPFVPKLGNCTLFEAAEPILDTLNKYTTQNPYKPICLVGVSNGGRIVTWLEIQLRLTAKTTPIKISTIAGVHFGSTRIDMICKSPFLRRITKCSPSICQELSHGSKISRWLIEKMQKSLASEPIRSYEFFVSTEDLHIPQISLIKLSHSDVKYHVKHGYGHSSIVAGVQKVQLASAEIWLLRQSGIIKPGLHQRGNIFYWIPSPDFCRI